MCVCDPMYSEGWHYIQWIGTYFGACVYTPLDISGFTFGITNICCWLFVQAPQLWENYRTKKVESLAFWFLATWLLGDITNLLGCIYTHQLPVQLYTAIYFCAIDTMLLSQYLYYRCRQPKQGEQDPLLSSKTSYDVISDVRGDVDNNDSDNENGGGAEGEESARGNQGSSSRNYSMPVVLIVGALTILQLVNVGAAAGTMESRHSRVLLDITDETICGDPGPLSSSQIMVGNVCAWISGLLYFYSRIPQIQQTHRLKSVEGLSLPMFIMSTFGNILYTLSVVLPTNNDSLHGNAFWNATLAYLVGSIGPLLLSIVIYWQFWVFRYRARFANRRSNQVNVNSSAY